MRHSRMVEAPHKDIPLRPAGCHNRPRRKMKAKLKNINGSITAPRGFLAAGVFCDIKRLGTGKGSAKGRKRDLALILSEVPATAAGMFTTNQVCAAPVKVCIPRVAKGTAQALVVNSGNANACTGPQGLRDALEMTALAAAQFHLPPAHVLVGSTGRIGVPLPMQNVRQGIRQAAQLLGHDPAHAAEAAEAIMTSDTRAKQIAVEIKLGGQAVRLGGICKGAGMIQPGMSMSGARPAARQLHATMLCFLTTDAALERAPLQAALQEAVAQSFNRITVDGDMSTNDTVLLLANGLAENAPLTSVRASGFPLFQAALNHVCLELAKMIVRDGEGVTRFVTVRVRGARSYVEADAAARAVANSALVKTSWFGGDPNWGRIIDALGYSQAAVVEKKVDIGYSAPGRREVLWSLRRGQPTRTPFRRLCGAVAAPEFDLHINLNLGRAAALIYAADLTEAYVDFNKGDVSDPASLGG
jgi:glutamate N-acetyltransferase / amino-acid N-acetyltransferase